MAYTVIGWLDSTTCFNCKAAMPTKDTDYSCHTKAAQLFNQLYTQGPYHAISCHQLLLASGVDTQTHAHTHTYAHTHMHTLCRLDQLLETRSTLACSQHTPGLLMEIFCELVLNMIPALLGLIYHIHKIYIHASKFCT